VSITRSLVIVAGILSVRVAPAQAQEPPPGPPPPPPPHPAPAAVATEPAPPPPSCPCEPPEEWHPARAARISGGIAFTEGLSHGAYGRLEFEEYRLKPHSEGLIGGILLGAEGWGAKDAGGGGLPFTWYGGFRGRRSVFATLGFGWDWVIYDRVEGDGGFGIFAPMTTANFGADFEGVRVLIDGRAQYRWQWGADDHYQIMAGLAISITDDH
jgi:hypothetical protein